jgi:hypothetical protein
MQEMGNQLLTTVKPANSRFAGFGLYLSKIRHGGKN